MAHLCCITFTIIHCETLTNLYADVIRVRQLSTKMRKLKIAVKKLNNELLQMEFEYSMQRFFWQI